MAKELKNREDVAVENTWALEDLYATKEAWEADIKVVESIGAKVSALEGKVCESAATLLETMKLLEELDLVASKAGVFAHCRSDQDTGNSEFQAMDAKVESVLAEVYGNIAFIDPEILEAVDKIEGFYKAEPELLKFKNTIDDTLRLKDHTLSAEMEKLLAMSEEVRNAPSNTFGLLNNADISFPVIKDENGEEVKLSHGRFIGMLQSSDRLVRKEAFEKYYGVYKQFLNTYASLYNGNVKGLIYKAKARKYNNTLEAAVSRNNVTPKVYENLVNGASVEDVLNALKQIGAPADIEAKLNSFVTTMLDEELVIDAETSSKTVQIDENVAKEDNFEFVCEEYNDAQDMLLADPIHEVKEETGWTPEADSIGYSKEETIEREKKSE